ncbi:YchJ family metal-binding protein [Microbacterium sp. NC79]|uniref:YchJ family protein n=1 Tax=Microbacterium sp. NC79 TaxID=2851009 RepID=UPI001C2C0AB0|nr:SEC-C domain-containing protein [Microbacterium sp. NC79]
MTAADCPCGTGLRYAECCEPFHRGDALPPTPLALMRSRYSAFARGLDSYLTATWHPGTLQGDVVTDAGTRWTRLEIIDAPEPTPRRGVVEFVAHYREGGRDHELHERSRFVFQSGRWWYLDGEHN